MNHYRVFGHLYLDIVHSSEAHAVGVLPEPRPAAGPHAPWNGLTTGIGLKSNYQVGVRFIHAGN